MSEVSKRHERPDERNWEERDFDQRAVDALERSRHKNPDMDTIGRALRDYHGCLMGKDSEMISAGDAEDLSFDAIAALDRLEEQLEIAEQRLAQAHARLTHLGVPTHDDGGGPLESVALRISVLADSFPARDSDV